MPFNTDDTKKAPYTGECMTLTNDEVIKVQDKCVEVSETFEPDDFTPIITDSYIIARYNESNNYEEAINGATYDVVKVYDREINTQGIDVNGIIPEPQPEEPEEPTEEQPEEVEETPVEEVQPEEATTEEETTPEEAPEAPEAE